MCVEIRVLCTYAVSLADSVYETVYKLEIYIMYVTFYSVEVWSV